MNNKNILFINTGVIWGGVEGWHYKTSKELAKRGYNVYILAAKDTPFYNECKKENLKVDTINIIGNGTFLNLFKVLSLKKYLINNKIDVMFFCQSSHFKFASLAGFLAGVEKIIYRRALANPINNHLYNRIALKNFITHFMAISETTLSKSIQNLPENFINKKIRLIYNGVRKDDFLDPKIESNLREEFSINRDDILIANIGRLCHQKSQQDLLKALYHVKRKTKKFKVLFVGSGDKVDEYKKLTKELDLKENVIFTGFRKDIPSILSQIDFVVHTALYEGCPWIVLETMASGKPIVAVDIPSIRELVLDGKTGYLSLRNKDELAENIFRMIRNKDKEKMGEKARSIFKDKYTFELMINKIEDYFLS